MCNKKTSYKVLIGNGDNDLCHWKLIMTMHILLMLTKIF